MQKCKNRNGEAYVRKKTFLSDQWKYSRIEFEHGTAYVTAVTDTIMNVFVPYQSKDHRSKAIEGDKRLPVTVDVSEEGGAVQIKTDKLTAKVYDDF